MTLRWENSPAPVTSIAKPRLRFFNGIHRKITQSDLNAFATVVEAICSERQKLMAGATLSASTESSRPQSDTEEPQSPSPQPCKLI